MNLYEVLAGNSSFVKAMTIDPSIGMDSLDVHSSPNPSPDWTPPSFEEVAAVLGCLDCDACSLQWCTAVPGKAFFNARFLRACPKIQLIDECLPLEEAETTL